MLHLALFVWFPGCLLAFWWQVHRASGGNGLSYLYSVEWPVFALAGAWGWWQLVHTEPGAVGRRAQARMAAAEGTPDGTPAATPSQPVRHREEEDPALAAYNDRLARLAAGGPKGWRRR